MFLSSDTGKLSENDENSGTHGWMERDRNSVFTRSCKAFRLKFVDQEIRQIYISAITDPRLGEFRKIFLLWKFIEGAVGEQFNYYLGKLIGHSLIDPIFGFKHLQQTTFLKRFRKYRICSLMATIHIVRQKNRNVIEK